MYIKRTGTTKLPVIPLNYKQVFKDKTSETQSAHKTKIAEKIQKNIITNEDIEIIKFIFKFGSVSLEQIYRFVCLSRKDNADISFSSIEKQLERLVNYKIIHKYIFSDNIDEIIKDDAFVLYCLNAGGAYILKNFSESEDIINWAMHKEIKDASKVLKGLTAAEFYLDIHETCPDKLEFFDVRPELRNGVTKVVPSFVFCLNKKGKGSDLSYFVCEVFNENSTGVLDREKDSLSQFTAKLRRLEDVFKSSWNKCYGDNNSNVAPMLFVIGNPGETDTKELLLELSRIVLTTDIDKFRLTSLEFINHRDLSEAGAFMRYKTENDSLVKIRASNFKPLEGE